MTARPNGYWPVWSTEELDLLRFLWERRDSSAAIADALGRTTSAVRSRAQLLGLRRRRRAWSRREDFALAELLDEHTPYPDIAASLDRTVTAVRDRCARTGLALSRANGRTTSATAQLLGVDQHAVAWWIREGWLRAVGPNTRMGRGRLRVVEEEDLHAFLADEALWHLWEPSRITDIALRDWATAERRGLVFLTGAQAGDRLGLSHHRVNQLIHKGRLRAVRRGGAGQAARRRATERPLGGNWLIRSDWLVVAPSTASKSRGRKITDQDRRQIRRWWGRVPTTWLAWRLGLKSDGAMHRVAREMGLKPIGRGYWKTAASLAGGTPQLGREAAAAP